MSTANELETKVRRIFETFQSDDGEAYRALLHPDFRFTSPYDDAIDRDGFMERCWPNRHRLRGLDLKRILTSGDEAFVLYEATALSGESFHNAENLVFRDGFLWRVRVFFGDLPTGHGR